ncbi:MAG: VanZ family protein [Bacteroidia bacterium]|nr:VanZ family protein [Bacteroidia bacterium]
MKAGSGKIRYFFKWFPVVTWGIFIFIACCKESSGLPKFSFLDFKHSDKFIHFVLFFILAALLYRGFYLSLNRKGKNVLIFLICLTYGGLIEVYQSMFTTTRHGELADIVADVAGSLFAILILNSIYFKIKNKKIR